MLVRVGAIWPDGQGTVDPEERLKPLWPKVAMSQARMALHSTLVSSQHMLLNASGCIVLPFLALAINCTGHSLLFIYDFLMSGWHTDFQHNFTFQLRPGESWGRSGKALRQCHVCSEGAQSGGASRRDRWRTTCVPWRHIFSSALKSVGSRQSRHCGMATLMSCVTGKLWRPTALKCCETRTKANFEQQMKLHVISDSWLQFLCLDDAKYKDTKLPANLQRTNMIACHW